MTKPRRIGFIDESFDVDASGSIVILALVRVGDRADDARRALTDLLLPGAEFLHFTKEDDLRRPILARTVGTLGLDPMVVVRQSRDSVARARGVCLSTLVWAAHDTVDHLVVEARGGAFDRTDARQLSRHRPGGRRLGADFLGNREDPLLWAADILASATFQSLVRKVPDYLEALGEVERLDC
jgi:hypothetical protein